MTTLPYCVQRLQEGLNRKKEANPSYSLRAYARDLDVDPSLLSKIMAGKRPVPPVVAGLAVQLLKLDPKEKTLFLESVGQERLTIDQIKIAPADSYFMLDDSFHKAIAEWEHYAVLSLFDLEGFTPSVSSIARYLGISETRSHEVIQTLIHCELLGFDENFTLIKSVPTVRTTEDTRSKALLSSHLETLELGKKKLQEVEVELRDFSSTTVAIDMEKLTEAKSIIREFRQKMMALLKSGKRTEVYQLAIQFYPMTNVHRGDSK